MIDDNRPSNGWNRYEIAVLQRLDKHEAKLDRLEERISSVSADQMRAFADMREVFGREIAELQAKAAFAGGSAGLVVGAIVVFVFDLIKRAGG